MWRVEELRAWASDEDLGPALAAAGVLAGAMPDWHRRLNRRAARLLLADLVATGEPLEWRDPFLESPVTLRGWLVPASELADAWRAAQQAGAPMLLVEHEDVTRFEPPLVELLERAGAQVIIRRSEEYADGAEEGWAAAEPPPLGFELPSTAIPPPPAVALPETMPDAAPERPRMAAPPPQESVRTPEEAPAQAAPPEDSPTSAARYAQGRVLRGEQQMDVFTTGAEHEVRVFIGPPEEGALSTGKAFPKVSTVETVKLDVVFAPLEEGEPQTDTLTLPPAGRSTDAIFTLRAPAHLTTLSARVLVMHGNRVLQSWLLTGPVLAEGVPADGQIAFLPESLPRLHTDDLDQRQAFDVAVVANHGKDGRSRALIAGNQPPVMLRLSERELSGALDRIRKRLEKAVENPRSFTKLSSPRSVALLVSLAHLGIVLGRPFHHLRARAGGPVERLQIVDAHPEAYLPLEFLYDFPAPKKVGAKLCAEGAALLTGPADVPCPATHTRDVVCPLGFWGLNRIIERHLFRPDRDGLPEDGWQVTFEPAAGRERLRLRRAAVFAASELVDRYKKGSTARAEAALRKSIGSVTAAADWEAWVDAVAEKRPGLLLALPHVGEDVVLGLPAMWIGKDAVLASSEVCAEHVRADATGHVAVFLLGCGTAVSEAPFTHFPAAFREGGAQLVFGTLTKVLGRHAAPIAVALTNRLLESCGESGSVTFGEELRALRRRLLAELGPAALALVAYGDADWVLEVA